MAHKWARWLHNPYRLGGPQRFRAGGKIRSGPKIGGAKRDKLTGNAHKGGTLTLTLKKKVKTLAPTLRKKNFYIFFIFFFLHSRDASLKRKLQLDSHLLVSNLCKSFRQGKIMRHGTQIRAKISGKALGLVSTGGVLWQSMLPSPLSQCKHIHLLATSLLLFVLVHWCSRWELI